jgi:hypothetical protein
MRTAGKLFIAVILSVYYYFLVFSTNLSLLLIGSKQGFDPLYYIDILMHEAGHLLATPIYAMVNYDLSSASAVFYMFAGTGMQWLMPLLFVLYFVFKKQPFSVFVTLFWLGQSFYDTVPYIADSIRMVMPLLSKNAIHDWNFLLTTLGYLPQTYAIAQGLLIVAIATLSVSLVGVWVFVVRSGIKKI